MRAIPRFACACSSAAFDCATAATASSASARAWLSCWSTSGAEMTASTCPVFTPDPMSTDRLGSKSRLNHDDLRKKYGAGERRVYGVTILEYTRDDANRQQDREQTYAPGDAEFPFGRRIGVRDHGRYAFI